MQPASISTSTGRSNAVPAETGYIVVRIDPSIHVVGLYPNQEVAYANALIHQMQAVAESTEHWPVKAIRRRRDSLANICRRVEVMKIYRDRFEFFCNETNALFDDLCQTKHEVHALSLRQTSATVNESVFDTTLHSLVDAFKSESDDEEDLGVSEDGDDDEDEEEEIEDEDIEDEGREEDIEEEEFTVEEEYEGSSRLDDAIQTGEEDNEAVHENDESHDDESEDIEESEDLLEEDEFDEENEDAHDAAENLSRIRARLNGDDINIEEEEIEDDGKEEETEEDVQDILLSKGGLKQNDENDDIEEGDEEGESEEDGNEVEDDDDVHDISSRKRLRSEEDEEEDEIDDDVDELNENDEEDELCAKRRRAAEGFQ
ncbi:hypothetical protein DFQ28_001934 [Apophysomyces sp. BC1034]|nr:hypothetical protein DFQ30_004332 [Apophysomyces sp. BC1015]KAG0179852.1 hypothetical protein DFQ29_001543 [Apophysomyces sp. BC1021]KAG0190538.1 hypothetical protein DFQ28_001934 [Apophysomyces sp. BC1034]